MTCPLDDIPEDIQHKMESFAKKHGYSIGDEKPNSYHDLTWEKVKTSNPIVYGTLRNGGTVEDCCVALVHALNNVSNSTMEYKMLAPFNITLPDGKVMIWRCPDKFVPDRTIDYQEIGEKNERN
jgi:hypothetical protein